MKNDTVIEFTQAELQVLIFALRLDLETVGNMVSSTAFTATERNEFGLMKNVYSKLCLYVEQLKV